MRKIIKLVALATVVALLAVAVVGCGDEQTTEEAQQQLVTDLQAFEGAVQSMSDLTVNSTVDEWQAARESTQAAWDKVVVSAADVKEAEIGQVQTSWENLSQSVDDLGGDMTLQEAVPTLKEEITALKAAWQDLYDGLQ